MMGKRTVELPCRSWCMESRGWRRRPRGVWLLVLARATCVAREASQTRQPRRARLSSLSLGHRSSEFDVLEAVVTTLV
jgi:hypothetical protein